MDLMMLKMLLRFIYLQIIKDKILKLKLIKNKK